MDYIIRKAEDADHGEVFALYQSLLGTPGCTWDEGYPLPEDVRGDIERQMLLCLCAPDGEIVGAAAMGEDDDEEEEETRGRFCDLFRVGVKTSHQNRGLAKRLVRAALEDAARQGFDGVKLLVSKGNPPAIALYESVGFVRTGDTVWYGHDWFCYEFVF